MTDAELVDLAVKMRAAQNDFYRNGRSPAAFDLARDLERRFDREVKLRAKTPQPGLFDALPENQED